MPIHVASFDSVLSFHDLIAATTASKNQIRGKLRRDLQTSLLRTSVRELTLVALTLC